MGNMSGDYGGHYTLWQSITLNSQDIANNKSNVTVRMYLSFDGSSYYAYTNNSTSGTMMVDGFTLNYSIDSINFSSGQAKDILLAEWTGYVNHKADGTQTLNVTGSWNTNTSRIGSGTCSASLVLTTISRYATFTKLEAIGKTVNSITISWACDVAVDDCQYSLNGGNYISGVTYPDYIINGLVPNTKYEIRLRAKRRDSGLYSESGVISVTTFNIGTLTSAPNINFGDTSIIIKDNPSGAQNDLRIETISPSVTIATRTQIANNYTLILTDEEWDALYKMLGNSNSIAIRYVIDTIGDVKYHHWLDRTLTLKGNQKTIRTNVSSTWRRGKLWTNVNGTWKRGALWTNVNGTWKRGI